LGGIGFAAAHELLHSRAEIDQRIQRLLTTFLFYPHYKVIHIRSHHVHAGTACDENTAWLNESIYAYIARTIPGSMIRSWQLEARRLSSTGRPAGRTRPFRNPMLHFAVGQLALLIGLFLLAGGWGILFYLVQVLGSHVVLESVNYIQHYGLLRAQHDGEYEKTGPEHSWDTYHYFSSYVTFRVGHHSNHHLAVQPYYLLAAEPDAPKLPVGYLWAIAIVLLPPWWRRVAHPRLTALARPMHLTTS
jgi:alkane 1-monooxygenase